MNKYQRLFNELQKERESSPSDVNDNILVFDGLNTFIRAFGATPSTNEDGEHIGGITGFLFSVGKTIRDFKPSRCIIVFDGQGGSRRRKSIDKNYKANRANKTKLRRFDHHFASIEDEQKAMRYQFSRLVSYLDCLPLTFLAIDGIEADDTIAYIADMYQETCKKITIVSTDRDFYQLIDDKIQIWSPIKKKMYTTETLLEEIGIHPNNYVVYKSFIGDISDNISGVNGIGPKTVLKLFPELQKPESYIIDQIIDKSIKLISESKKYQKIVNNMDILNKNNKLMDLKLFDISATHKSNIRNIVSAPINTLNKAEFRKIFLEDKMWNTMKNLPDWLNNTWLTLNAFANQTQ